MDRITLPQDLTIAVCCSALQDSGVSANVAGAVLRAHELGFGGVELSAHHVLSERGSLREIVDLIQSSGLRLVGLHNAVPRSVVAFDEKGAIQPTYRTALKETFTIAVELCAPLITVGIGSSRRLPRDMPPATATLTLLDLFSTTAHSTGYPGTISFEIISSKTAGFGNTAKEVQPLLDALEMPRVGLTCDTYQSFRQGVDPVEEIEHAGRHLVHLHVAELDRRPPGTAGLRTDLISDALRRVAFCGAVSVEPSPRPDDSDQLIVELKNSVRHLRSCLDKRVR